MAERKMGGRIYLQVEWPAEVGDVVDWVAANGKHCSRVVAVYSRAVTVERPGRSKGKRVAREHVLAVWRRRTQLEDG